MKKQLRITVAIDSFKGSISSMEAGAAVTEGILRAIPDSIVTVKPLADGGEGTTQALIEGMGAKRIDVVVSGPLLVPVKARYGYLSEEQTAIIEMASAAGITLIDKANLNPEHATTFGVGQMIKDAARRGARHFIIGIGGSATNDGGTGMLRALGYEFLDENNTPVPEGAAFLNDIRKIKPPIDSSHLKNLHFSIACDVTNPLLGKNGATYVYGPQKGIASSNLECIERGMASYAAVSAKFLRHDDKDIPGCGAAGGLGFAFKAYLNAELLPGTELILKLTRLEEDIRFSDIVVTGEGQLDKQTAFGKAPIGVASLAKKHGATVIAFSGSVTKDAAALNSAGIDAFFPILRGVTTLFEAMKPETAKENLSAAAEQVFRLIDIQNK